MVDITMVNLSSLTAMKTIVVSTINHREDDEVVPSGYVKLSY